MKKLILCCAVALVCASCSPFGHEEMDWYVSNGTEQVLKFEYPYCSTNDDMVEYVVKTLSAKEVVFIGESWSKGNNGISFSHYFEKCADLYGDDVYWRISSNDGTVLKTWKYADRGGNQEIRFFDKTAWKVTGDSEWAGVWSSWTFEILPEDIQTN